MAIDITPEYAQALRDGTASSPWIVEDYGGNRPEVMIETSDGDTLAADVEPDVAQLIAHAPALAELVANMHYEYVVEVQSPPLTSYDTPTWEPLQIRGLRSVFATLQGAQSFARGRVAPTRIVRRLVTDTEVVE